MAWPYAVYTDPAFAATVLQAAAASAHANGSLPDIAAIANVYQYSAAAAAAAAGPSYFHNAVGGDYGKFQSHQYVVGPPAPPPPPPPPQPVPLQQMMKKSFGLFSGHHHHHHHHHHQFATDAADAEHNNHAASASVGYDDNKTDLKTTDVTAVTAAAAAVDNNKTTTTSSSSSSSAADAADYSAGTSCKCGIVDCVLTTNGKSVSSNNDGGTMSAASTPPTTTAVDHLPPSAVSFLVTTNDGPETGPNEVLRSSTAAECSLAAVHKHVYHKEHVKNKLFQPYKPDVTTAKLNL